MSRLQKVQSGLLSGGLRYLFYGPPGVGKSTLGQHAPNPIFLDIEDGSGRLDVARYPFRDGAGGHVPRLYSEVLEAIQDLRTNSHDYRTLVIDTLDRLEPLIWAHVVKEELGKDVGSVEEIPYGKGYNMATGYWRRLCTELDGLKEKGMDVVLVAHSVVRTFQNPMGADYDRYQLALHKAAGPILIEWADVVGFCSFDEAAAKLGGEKRNKGFSTGRRLIHLERAATWDAKCRVPVPSEVELSLDNPWLPLSTALEAGKNLPPKEIVARIEIELERIGDPDLCVRVRDAYSKSMKDIGALNRYWHTLQSRESLSQ